MDFVVVARIDAAATLGDEELLVRAKACVKLGVDVILPHMIRRRPNSRKGTKKR